MKRNLNRSQKIPFEIFQQLDVNQSNDERSSDSSLELGAEGNDAEEKFSDLFNSLSSNNEERDWKKKELDECFLTMKQGCDLKSIFLVKPEKQKKISLERIVCWEGTCIDTGAQITVIKFKKASAYLNLAGIKSEPNRSSANFRFGD